jgi:hypothetical protein
VTLFLTLVITGRDDDVLPQSQTYLTSCKNIHSKNPYEKVVLGQKKPTILKIQEHHCLLQMQFNPLNKFSLLVAY